MKLKYKNVVFDDYIKDEYGVWATICEKCQDKHKDTILQDQESISEGGGVCGVEGCSESDWETETEVEMGYIDFNLNSIKYIAEGIE